jgi:hypothetical protein
VSVALVAFHGADGDRILAIVKSRVLLPSAGFIYLGATAEMTYMHGVDLRRRAAYSLELRVRVDPSMVTRMATPGTPLTIRIETLDEVPIEVVSLRVRRPRAGAWHEETVLADMIERYLEGNHDDVAR